MAYIIEPYNRYDQWDKEHSKYIFEINGLEYAIKQVILFWGRPQLPTRIEENINPETYHLYEDYDDAMRFVRYMRQLNL